MNVSVKRSVNFLHFPCIRWFALVIVVAVTFSPLPARARSVNVVRRYSVEHVIDARHNYHSNYHERSRNDPIAPRSEALPSLRLTPGAIDSRVTQANLNKTICRPGGYTRSVRPPEFYTERLKYRQVLQYGYADTRAWHYEEDHLISLELGGSAKNPKNLWPEPHYVVGGWGSYTKDELENRLHDLVCSRRIPLATAQRVIATDWIAAFKRYIGPHPAKGGRYRAWRYPPKTGN